MSNNIDRVKMGKNVTIGEGTVLNAMSLMLEIVGGKRVRSKILYGVVIEDDVEIGANSVINCGVNRDTIIRYNSFIGHLSMIGHDCDIGRHTVVATNVSVCGHVEIGEWCYIATGTIIRPRVKIGSYSMIGLGSIVTKDIPEGVIAFGNPCKVVRENKWRPN